MKTHIFRTFLIFVSLNIFCQNKFECNDFDFYNRDTILIFQYKMFYDSTLNKEIKAIEKAINHGDVTEGINSIDTIQKPRYKVHLSEEDYMRLENTLLCCIDWLLTNDYYKNKVQWSEVENFVLSANSVLIVINDNLINTLKAEAYNDEMILNYYRLGVIRFITLKTFEPDETRIELAGMLALYQLYMNSPEISDDMPKILADYNRNHDEDMVLEWIRNLKTKESQN